MKISVIFLRLRGLIYKETLQIFRDPSSILIAFVLPLILLFLYGYGVSLDIQNLKIGMVLEDNSAEVQEFVRAFKHSKFFDLKISYNREIFEQGITSGEIKGIIIIPQDFTKKLKNRHEIATIQIITDGSEPNTASFVQNYAQGVWQNWLLQLSYNQPDIKSAGLISLEPRFWFNAELLSRNSLVPGTIAIIMALAGTLLTSLVVAREWERGTMEAMMATPITIFEIILGKLIPYFLLGMVAMIISLAVGLFLFNIPFRGSLIWLFISSSAFMFAALGMGLLISSVAKNQFVAAQISMFAAFLPAFLLSGFIFEISSMPMIIQIITYIIPARYFVSSLQTIFLTGDVLPILIPNAFYMTLIGLFFFIVIAKNTTKRLD